MTGFVDQPHYCGTKRQSTSKLCAISQFWTSANLLSEIAAVNFPAKALKENTPRVDTTSLALSRQRGSCLRHCMGGGGGGGEGGLGVHVYYSILK